MDGGEKWMRKLGEGEVSMSFFVTKFGEQWKAKDPFYEFKALSDIVEVVIPPGRDI